MADDEGGISADDDEQFLEVLGVTAATLFHALHSSLGLLPKYIRAARNGVDDREALLSAFDLIEEAINGAIELLRSLESYGSLRLGLSAEPVAVNAIVSRVSEEALRATSGDRQALVDLRLELAPSMPLAKANERHLGEVVRNLVDNALHAARSGDDPRVVVKTYYGGGLVTIDVTDTGCGFPPSVVPHLFRRSVREQNAHGLGLGLLISRRLMLFWEGDLLLAENGPGGATVRAVLRSCS
jgi:signal transduction histidine kinase